MNKPAITVVVEGGVVQSVFSSDPNTEVTLIDWDDYEDASPEEEKGMEVTVDDRIENVTPHEINFDRI